MKVSIYKISSLKWEQFLKLAQFMGTSFKIALSSWNCSYFVKLSWNQIKSFIYGLKYNWVIKLLTHGGDIILGRIILLMVGFKTDVLMNALFGKTTNSTGGILMSIREKFGLGCSYTPPFHGVLHSTSYGLYIKLTWGHRISPLNCRNNQILWWLFFNGLKRPYLGLFTHNRHFLQFIN